MAQASPKPLPPRPGTFPTLASYRDGPLAAYLGGDVAEIGAGDEPAGARAAVASLYRLQDEGDYRGALQRWFAMVREGGHLIVTVPHAFLYERQAMLPSRLHPRQRRLYTPKALAEEIEEALAPNSYRLRWLGDQDAGYDYGAGRDSPPIGRHDVAAVIEKIATPDWGLQNRIEPEQDRPDFNFEPDRTRIEMPLRQTTGRILAIKLDHLGDFIMGVPAIEKLRAGFPDAHLTLVVGSWNRSLAEGLGLADTVIAFDAYPRNSSEVEPDPRGRAAMFEALITDEYDLAIDLRSDADTRFLLRNVRARVKAGLGTRAEFPHLDIFVPIDTTRHHREAAWEDVIPLHQFNSQYFCRQTHYQVSFTNKRMVYDKGAIVWGPYRHLAVGHYLFEPFIEIDGATPGLLGWDVALDIDQAAYGVVDGPTEIRAGFHNATEGARFEFRLFAINFEPVPNFRFYGGRLIKQGAASVLHQSEYLQLLVELVALRLGKDGLLTEVRSA